MRNDLVTACIVWFRLVRYSEHQDTEVVYRLRMERHGESVNEASVRASLKFARASSSQVSRHAHAWNPGANREKQERHEKLQRQQGGHAPTDSIQGSQDRLGQRFCHQRVSWPQALCYFWVFGARDTAVRKGRVEQRGTSQCLLHSQTVTSQIRFKSA